MEISDAQFAPQMYKIIASHLHKYRSPEVRLGRITTSADLKYLGKKVREGVRLGKIDFCSGLVVLEQGWVTAQGAI